MRKISFFTLLTLIVVFMFLIKYALVQKKSQNNYDKLSEPVMASVDNNYINDNFLNGKTIPKTVALSFKKNIDKNKAIENISDVSNEKQGKEQVINVLLSADSGGYLHRNPIVFAKSCLILNAGNSEKKISKGTYFNLTDYFADNSCDMISLTVDKDSAEYKKDAAVNYYGIVFSTINDKNKASGYGGKVNVVKNDEDSFYFINELPLETYLYGVVSGEMPSDFGIEALKCQAVCARSYAASAINNPKNTTAQALWNVRDTTDDQVYRPGKPENIIKTACEETKNQVLVENGKIIKPHYYSTSWGQNAGAGVFNTDADNEFKAAAASSDYLKNTEHEKEFANKISNFTGENDNKFPWFRWSCTINLAQIFKKSVSDVKVISRSSEEYVSGIEIDYSDKTENVFGAGSIRKKLADKSTVYKLSDGSTRTGLDILPSPFFYIKKVKDNKLVIEGGGYGHGCGMSQYGASQMGKSGTGYKDILKYYYSKAAVKTLT